MVILDVNVS